ncbi:MAG: mitochondrial fission ELM1 family protein [Gammaproteobacteria bacterium]
MARTVVWHLSDGKPGHDNQSRGLIRALGRLTALECHELNGRDLGRRALWPTVAARFRRGLPDPALLIGAGHATHLPMLAARIARGGKAVVLMKPSLPLCWFDLCLIPEHDRPPVRDNVLVTQGVLNTVRASDRARPGIGLILVGGPSSHHRWDGPLLVRMVRTIVDAHPMVAWRIADSRRTPACTRHLLRAISSLSTGAAPNCDFVPHEETGPEWLSTALAEAGTVWVTEDSVSMLYEALSAGAATGLLPVPRRRRSSRPSRGVDALLASGQVTAFERWAEGAALPRLAVPLCEAERCARALLARWPEIDGR